MMPVLYSMPQSIQPDRCSRAPTHGGTGWWRNLIGSWITFWSIPLATAGVLPEYPIGIYTGGRTNDLPAIKAAGFNIVTGPASKSYLDAAKRQGLKVFAMPHTSAGPAFNAAKARGAVRAYDGHPALWAWYLIDEPDLNMVAPEHVERAHRFLKSAGARKPTAVVLFRGDEARFYAGIPDMLMLDRYPIPWIPLANFGQHVRLAKLSAGPTKPLIAIIQAFDWSYFPELVPGESNLRPPTRAELRCMTFDALARGANGIFYYSYDARAWKLRVQTEVWEDLAAVVSEVNRLKPLFAAEPAWWHGNVNNTVREKQRNAALEPSVIVTALRVRNGSFAVPMGLYLLAVNTTDSGHTIEFSSPVREVSTAPVLGEDRELTAAEGRFKDHFVPFGIHVYGPFKAP